MDYLAETSESASPCAGGVRMTQVCGSIPVVIVCSLSTVVYSADVWKLTASRWRPGLCNTRIRKDPMKQDEKRGRPCTPLLIVWHSQWQDPSYHTEISAFKQRVASLQMLTQELWISPSVVQNGTAS